MADTLKAFVVTVIPAGSDVRRRKTVLARSRNAAQQMVSQYRGDRILVSAPGLVAELKLRAAHLRGPNERDIRAFYSELRSSLKSDPSLASALRSVLPTVQDTHIANAVCDAVAEADRATGVDGMLGALKGVLPIEHIERLRASATTGDALKVIEALGKSSDRAVQISGKLVQAIVMPAITVLAAVGAAFFVAGTQLPALAKVFAASKTPLPLPSQILLECVEFAKAWPIVGFAALLTPAWVIWITPRVYATNGRFQDLCDRIPVFGLVLVRLRTARMLRTLSMLLEGNQTHMRSIEYTARSTTNQRARRFWNEVARTMAKTGDPIFEAARLCAPILGDVDTRWIDLLQLGAKNGDIHGVLSNVAADAEERAEAVIDTLPKFLEVAAIGIAGMIVAGVMLATLLPGMRLVNVIK